MRKIKEATAFHIKINNLRLLAPCPVRSPSHSPSARSPSNCPGASSCSLPSAISASRSTSSLYSSRYSVWSQLFDSVLVFPAQPQRAAAACLATGAKWQQLLGAALGCRSAPQGAGQARPSHPVVGLATALRLAGRPATANPHFAAKLRGRVARSSERRLELLSVPDRICPFI